MKIIDISGGEKRRGIPIKGWNGVRMALQAYAEGKSRGARLTTDHQHQALEQSYGGLSATTSIYFNAIRSNVDAFVERMLTAAEANIKKYGHWRHSYDYDGQGNFLKTNVEIRLWDKKEDIYVLELYAAYVGDEPEKGLAELLGVSRTLLWREIVITTEPLDKDRFIFDFDEIYKGIGELLGLDANVGQKIAKHMMTGDKHDEPGSFVLKDDGEVRIKIGPSSVESRFVLKEDNRFHDTWTVSGSTLTGLLAKQYDNPEKKIPPSIVITVSKKPVDNRESRLAPVWDNDLSRQITSIAHEIGMGMMSFP